MVILNSHPLFLEAVKRFPTAPSRQFSYVVNYFISHQICVHYLYPPTPSHKLILGILITKGRVGPGDVRAVLGVSYPTARRLLREVAELISFKPRRYDYRSKGIYQSSIIKLSKFTKIHLLRYKKLGVI